MIRFIILAVIILCPFIYFFVLISNSQDRQLKELDRQHKELDRQHDRLKLLAKEQVILYQEQYKSDIKRWKKKYDISNKLISERTGKTFKNPFDKYYDEIIKEENK